MYRDFWRLHVVAAIVFVSALGLAVNQANQGYGAKAALWAFASAACLGVLIAPLLLMRSAKQPRPPPQLHPRRLHGLANLSPGPAEASASPSGVHSFVIRLLGGSTVGSSRSSS